MNPFSFGIFESIGSHIDVLFNCTGKCADYWFLDYLGNFFNR